MKRALLVLCALVCVACGKKEQATNGPPRKVIIHNRIEAPKSLDPVKQFEVSSGELLRTVYSALFRYHYLKRPYQLEPDLLTKMPELSADGLTYSFELRQDVLFNDDACFPGGKGRVLNADDVIYSIKRYADANLNQLSYSLLQGAIVGMDAFRDQTRTLGAATDYTKLAIPGITKVDDFHFTIKLTQPNPLALFPFATTMLSIVPHEAIEHYKEQFEQHPVGSGPFFIKEMSRRGTIVLLKNPRYYLTYPTEGAPGDAEKGLLASAGKRMPLIDEVRLPLIEEPQPAVLKLLTGEIDWIAIDRNNFVKMAFKDASGFHLKRDFGRKFVLYAEPDPRTEFFAFNMRDPLLGKNRSLRQAIAYALDTPGFIDQMLNGRAEPLKTLIPLILPGNERDVPAQWYTRNLSAAKQKLVEAGYPGGKGLPPITFEGRSATQRERDHFEFLRAELAEIGITLVPNYQTFSAYLKKVESANFQITEGGWGADYPDAENFYALLYGPNKSPGANYSSYENPEYDKLYEQIRYMPNGPERFALFARMNELIRRDVPIIFTFNYYAVGLYQRWVKNFKRNTLIDMPFEYFDVDLALKATGVER
jgi:ABC-type transport system substrate-binding protein